LLEMDKYKMLRFFILPLYLPLRGIRELLSESKRLLYGVLIFLFLGIICTITVQIAVMRDVEMGITLLLLHLWLLFLRCR
jgi:hypothetical protein